MGTGTGRAGMWVLIATILGSSMAFIDGTVVNVALPVIQTDLHATVVEVQWIVEAYSLFLASLILVGGSLGDRFGRRRVYMLGVVLFSVASMACGLAPNATFLVFTRAVQGIGGALLTPGSLAIITSYFPARERGRAIGTWSGFTSITTALGPVLGGWLVQQASWRWVFFINPPIGLIVLAITFMKVPESRDLADTGSLDWQGATFATLGLGAITFGLITASSAGLGAPIVLVALALGVVALVVFILIERRSPNPMMPLSIFSSRTFSGANLLTLLLYAAIGGTTFFLPFNLIQVQGYTPTAAGAAFLPFILILFLLSRWAGGLVTRVGSRLPLMVGPTIAGIGLALLALPGIGGSYWTTFFPGIVVLGLGMAIAVAPLTTTVMGAVPSERAGVASGVNNAVARAAGLLAIAALSIVLVIVFSAALTHNLDVQNIAASVKSAVLAERTQLAAAQPPSGVSASTHAAVKSAIDQAYVAGFRMVMLVSAGLAVLSAVVAALTIEGKKPVVPAPESPASTPAS